MNIRPQYKIFCFIALFPNIAWAALDSADPCASLLALINRPTMADSVCSVKSGEFLIEVGAEYRELYSKAGHEYNYPEAQLRFGLPDGNEFNISTPNYIQNQNNNGYSATTFGLKHQFEPLGNLLYTLEGFFTPPSGDHDFGSDGSGVTVNGLVSYNFTPATALTIMLGYSSETTAFNDGGKRYNSFNPDIVFDWQLSESLQLYAEVYGQTKTGPDQSDGYNADTGIQYLLRDNIEIDIEYGQRISGQLADLSHYFGAGGGIRF